MKKYFLLGLALLVVILPSAQANEKGGLLIEPILSYEGGDGDVNYPSPINDSDVDTFGLGVGVRLGFHILDSILFGVDGRYSYLKYEDSGLDQNVGAKGWNYGPFLGLQMPTFFGVRVWGSFIYDGELNPEEDRDVDANFTDGQGYRVGAGFNISVVSFNLEYQKVSYDTTEINQVGVFSTGFKASDIELDQSTWIFSISFPFTI